MKSVSLCQFRYKSAPSAWSQALITVKRSALRSLRDSPRAIPLSTQPRGEEFLTRKKAGEPARGAWQPTWQAASYRCCWKIHPSRLFRFPEPHQQPASRLCLVSHRTAPDLQRRLDRPRRDPPDEFGTCTSAGDKCWPTSRRTEEYRTVDGIALRSAAFGQQNIRKSQGEVHARPHKLDSGAANIFSPNGTTRSWS